MAAFALSVLQHYPHEPRATAYCLKGRMADGSYTRPGSVANNRYKLGTKIQTRHNVFGRRNFVVRDRIGHGTTLDFWTSSCSQAIRFGRRKVAFRVVR